MTRSCLFYAEPKGSKLRPHPPSTTALRESLKFFTRVSWIVARGYIGRPGNRHRSGFIVRFTLQRPRPNHFRPPALLPFLAGGPSLAITLFYISSCG